MKKHTIIEKRVTENGSELLEFVTFSELSAREYVKQHEEVVAVISSERVSHPSPNLMVSALKEMNIDVSLFYLKCYELSINEVNNEVNNDK